MPATDMAVRRLFWKELKRHDARNRKGLKTPESAPNDCLADLGDRGAQRLGGLHLPDHTGDNPGGAGQKDPTAGCLQQIGYRKRSRHPAG